MATITISSLQGGYDTGGSPKITLNTTGGSFVIRDNSTPISGDLLRIEDDAATTHYLAVSAANGVETPRLYVNKSTPTPAVYQSEIERVGSLTSFEQAFDVLFKTGHGSNSTASQGAVAGRAQHDVAFDLGELLGVQATANTTANFSAGTIDEMNALRVIQSCSHVGTAVVTEMNDIVLRTPSGPGMSKVVDHVQLHLEPAPAGPTGTTYAILQDASGGDIALTGDIGFFGATPVAKPTVSGSRAGNAALADLLTELATMGLITDSSS